MQGLQYRSRSVSGTQDESLASSRHQSCAGGRPNAGSSVLSPRASSGRASGSYAAQIAAAAAHKSHHTGVQLHARKSSVICGLVACLLTLGQVLWH